MIAEAKAKAEKEAIEEKARAARIQAEHDAKEKAAKENTDCCQGRPLSGRGRGRAPTGITMSEDPDKGLRQSQTTEDNFKNVTMLNNDLKKFKKAPEHQADSKRRAEIQKMKGGTNPHR